jgi:general nucleoside transport system permease protein
MHDASALNTPLTDLKSSRGRSRFVLDVRQSLPAWKHALFLGMSLAVGVTISVAILALAGIAPIQLGQELGGMFNATSLHNVLVQAAPLILVGLAAGLAFRVGFWNLGLEGQMLFGGIFAFAISIYEIGPPQTRLAVMGVAAALGGALWCLLGGILKLTFRVNEVIATLLLNYIAQYFLFHLLYGAWQDAKTAFPQSQLFRPFERLHDLSIGINSGLLISIGAVLIAAWLVHISRVGFYMRIINANPTMAKVLGVPTRAVTLWSVAVSGACAGLAGFVNVASQEGRLTESYADGYLFSGVLIAFLSRNDPVVIAVVAFLIGALSITGQTLQVFYQIPFTMVQLIEAIIVMSVASSEFFVRHRVRWIRQGLS